MLKLSVFLSIVLLLAGCGDGSQSAAGPPASTLQGRVNIGGLPVPGSDVQLRSDGEVLATATSDESGQFAFDLTGVAFPAPAAQSNGVPADVIATVDGTQYAAVIPDGAGFVFVTEISTLIHGYMESHPGTALESAEAAVGAALGCPPDDSVATLSDSDIFDPATFQEVAKGEGGAEVLLDTVEAGIDGGDFDFGSPDLYEVLDYDRDPHHRVAGAGTQQSGIPAQQIAVPAAAVKLLSGAGQALAVGVIGDIGARGFGWVISSLTTNTDPSLNDVVEQLTTLQTTANQLRFALDAQTTRLEWHTALRPLLAHSATLSSYVDRLAIGVELRGSRPIDEPAPELPFVAEFLARPQFGYDSAETIARDFLNAMLAPPPTVDTVQSYHRSVMAEFGRSGAAGPDARLSSYDLRYNELTRKLQNNLNFQLSQVELATEMLANAAHNSVVTSGPGNLLPTSITNARAFVARGNPDSPDVANRFQRARQIVPDELPRDDVIVLPPSAFTAVVPGTPSLLYRGAWLTNLARPFDIDDFDRNRTEFLQASVGGDSTWGDVDNWRMPTLEQYVELDKLATAAGGGDAKAGLIKLGIISPTETRPLPGFTYQGARYQKRRVSRGSTKAVRHLDVAELDVFIFSRPGRARHAFRLIFDPDRSCDARACAGDKRPFLGSLFVRGSLSGDTREQFETLFATGTTVPPTRVDLRFEDSNERRVLAKASYRFPTGQEFELDVTDRVAWQSTDPTIMEVSNYDDEALPPGSLTRTRGGRTRITASLLTDARRLNDPAGYVIGEINADSSEGLLVHEILITPRNSIFTSTGDPVAFFNCTGFSRQSFPPDRNTHVATDLTNSPRLSWELLGPDGTLVDPSRARISTVSSDPNNPVRVGGVLRIEDRTLPNGTYRVRATSTGTDRDQVATALIDETKILIQLR